MSKKKKKSRLTILDNQYKQDSWLYKRDNRDKLYSRDTLLIDVSVKTQWQVLYRVLIDDSINNDKWLQVYVFLIEIN
jgi:hypothetical protein